MTHAHTHTLGRTPLDKGPALNRYVYLTTHNTHRTHTSITRELEPAIPALDHAGTGIGTRNAHGYILLCLYRPQDALARKSTKLRTRTETLKPITLRIALF
jgi:hypothetical protein